MSARVCGAALASMALVLAALAYGGQGERCRERIALECRAAHAEFAEREERLWTTDRFNVLSGIVCESDGTLAPDVTVSVLRWSTFLPKLLRAELSDEDALSGRLSLEAETCTDVEGKYSVRGLEYGSKSLWFQKGGAVARRDLDVVYPGIGRDCADATLCPRKERSVRLVNACGEAICGATIQRVPAKFEPASSFVITDISGAATILMEEDDRLLVRKTPGGPGVVMDPGRMAADGTLVLPTMHELVVELEFLHGVVSGSDCTVTVMRPEGRGAPASVVQVPAQSGVHSLGAYPEEGILVVARCGEGRVAAQTFLRHPGSNALLTMEPSASLQLVGSSFDSLDCRLVPVELVGTELDPRSPASYVVFRSSRVATLVGREQQGIPAGRYFLEPFGMQIDLRPGKAHSLELSSDWAATTRIVTSRPEEIVLVKGASASSVVLSDLSGEALLRGMPSGALEARVIGAEGLASLARCGVRGVASTLEFSVLDARAEHSSCIYGLVLDPEGMPIEGAEVFVQSVDGASFFLKREVSDADGFYRVADLLAGTPCVVLARDPKREESERRLIPMTVSAEGSRCDLTLPHSSIVAGS